MQQVKADQEYTEVWSQIYDTMVFSNLLTSISGHLQNDNQMKVRQAESNEAHTST